MILQALVIVQLRLDGHRAADEVRIAQLDGRHEIVFIVAVYVIGTGTEEQAVLLDIVAHAGSQLEKVGLELVVAIAQFSRQHPCLLEHVAALQAEVELPVL